MSEYIRQIRDRVEISVSNKIVQDRVVGTLVEAEIHKRASKITDGLTKIREAEAELKKLSEDIVTVVDGEEQKAFSKARWAKRKELEKKIGALYKAVDAAIGGDFSKLK